MGGCLADGDEYDFCLFGPDGDPFVGRRTPDHGYVKARLGTPDRDGAAPRYRVVRGDGARRLNYETCQEEDLRCVV